MKVAFFDTHRYDQDVFEAANTEFGHELTFLEPRLTSVTASLAHGFPAICSFVNDRLDRAAIERLAAGGTRLIALRSAGFNHVDLEAAAEFQLPVVFVPEYSPQAVAEHAVALIQAVNRKIHRAYNRVRDANFSLDGLVGVDLYKKTFGVIGTGRIGAATARIMHGFGCRLIGYDAFPNSQLIAEIGLEYVDLPTLYAESDVISLHLPLTPESHHLIGADALHRMKSSVILINTSRGRLIDSKALIVALKQGKIGAAGLDVYEEEEGVFFRDHSDEGLQDDVLARLLTFPNVLITSHQGFLTHEALKKIAHTTLESIRAFESGEPLLHTAHRQAKKAST